MGMSKDLERPPLVKPSRPVYDDNDPYVVQMVNQRAMTFNADTVGRAVEPRSDYCPNMNQTIDRDKAGQGTRLLQNDMATLVKKNGGLTETTGQLSVPVEKLTGSQTAYARSDLGMTFDQHKYRGVTRMKAEYSSLWRPRDHAAPDFSRTAPFQGFSTSTPVAQATGLSRDRSHEAMPGWSPKAADGLEQSDN